VEGKDDPVHIVKADFRPILASALDGGKYSILHSDRLTPRKEASVRIECESELTPISFRIFWRTENSFAPAGNMAKI
jgi:hypothetical protein